MNYYKDNSASARHWATAALLLYAAAVAVLFLCVGIDVSAERPGEAILVELAPLPEPEPAPEPEVAEPQPHAEPSPDERSEAAHGEAPAAQTVNPRALFRQSQSGPDEPENAGNPRMRSGEQDAARGRGAGQSPEGSDRLDRGLQGRGLVGALPKPRYSGNASGKVVVRVQVDRTGRVTSANYEPTGSTTSDPDLIREACKAALEARFTESASLAEGGTITYIFTLKR